MRFFCTASSLLLLTTGWLFTLQAQDDSSSLADLITSVTGKNQPRIGLIGSIDAEIRGSDTSTLSSYNVHVLRFYLRGSAGSRFSYVYQADLNGTAQTLDLKFTYKPADWLAIDAGQFKPVFGRDFLRPLSRLSFIYRSAAILALNPGRQRGVQITGTLPGNRLSAIAGVYSGNGITGASDSRISLFGGKIRATPAGTDGKPGLFAEVSGSTMYSNDDADLSTIPLLEHDRLLFNGQIRVAYDDVWTETEYGFALSNGIKTIDAIYYDLGWKIDPEWEIQGRFDMHMLFWMHDDNSGVYVRNPDGIDRRYLAGINWYPSETLKLQLNYERSQTHASNAGYLNVQYAVNDQ